MEDGGAALLPELMDLYWAKLGLGRARCAQEAARCREYWQRLRGARTNQVRLLAIDVGTQSARAIVFDAQETLLAKAQTPIEPVYHSPWLRLGRAGPIRVLERRGRILPQTPGSWAHGAAAGRSPACR